MSGAERVRRVGAMALAVASLALAQGPVRVLVVTGGHGYETSFYTVFEGYDDIHWSHAVSNHEAFRSDLRGKYDVLVLYDYSDKITDGERQNLRDFVEGDWGVRRLTGRLLFRARIDYGSSSRGCI